MGVTTKIMSLVIEFWRSEDTKRSSACLGDIAIGLVRRDQI